MTNKEIYQAWVKHIIAIARTPGERTDEQEAEEAKLNELWHELSEDQHTEIWELSAILQDIGPHRKPENFTIREIKEIQKSLPQEIIAWKRAVKAIAEKYGLSDREAVDLAKIKLPKF